MWTKFKTWWNKLTLNEKMMIGLVFVLLIGIATRWRYVFGEIGEAFTNIFNR